MPHRCRTDPIRPAADPIRSVPMVDDAARRRSSYDADIHCPTCTLARFGRADDGWIVGLNDDGTYPTDSEGNQVGAVAPWDEWVSGESGCETLSCGTCCDEIASAHVDLWGENCSENDSYDMCAYISEPVIIRDTGGSIPRTTAEWVETMLADAESIGADVSKIRAEWDATTDDDKDEWGHEWQDDIESAINDTEMYAVVANSDVASWCVYKRKIEAGDVPGETTT